MGVHKHPNSPNWYIRYKDGDGIWRSVSSGTTNKEEAEQKFTQLKRQAFKRRELGIEPVEEILYRNFKDEYIQVRTQERAAETVRLDEFTLDEFERVISRNFPVCEIRRQQVLEFKTRLQRRDLARHTVRQRLIHLNRALNWAVERNYLRKNPAKRVSFPSLPDPDQTVRLIPKDDVRTLIDHTAGHWIGDYIRAAIYGGFRASEITGIKETDIDRDAATVTVTGKYGKSRTVPIYTDLITLFDEILERSPEEDPRILSRSGHDGRRPGYLFYQVANVMSVSHAFKRAVREVWAEKDKRGKPKGKAPPAKDQYRFHDLRHTYATAFLRAGGDIYKLRRILGHRDISTTQKYEHLNPEDLRGEQLVHF